MSENRWCSQENLASATRRPAETQGGGFLQVTSVYTGNFGALTNELKKSPLVMLAAVEPVLIEAGLIRVSDAGWTVLPVTGRYRDPKAVWEPTLEDIA